MLMHIKIHQRFSRNWSDTSVFCGADVDQHTKCYGIYNDDSYCHRCVRAFVQVLEKEFVLMDEADFYNKDACYYLDKLRARMPQS